MNRGEKIRNYRLKAGLTQIGLAEMIYVTPQAVSNWERGERFPDPEFFPVLNSTIGISYNELFDGQKLEFYTDSQKEQLLKRCIGYAHIANKLCAMLDRWERESLEINKLEDEELKRRGVDISSPFRKLSDLDPLGLAHDIILKRKKETAEFVKEQGEVPMAYVLMILYLGEDIAHGVWELPEVSDPEYRDSVCRLLLTDQDDYHRLANPYYEIEEKIPELVASWIRSGLSIIIKAV